MHIALACVIVIVASNNGKDHLAAGAVRVSQPAREGNRRLGQPIAGVGRQQVSISKVSRNRVFRPWRYVLRPYGHPIGAIGESLGGCVSPATSLLSSMSMLLPREFRQSEKFHSRMRKVDFRSAVIAGWIRDSVQQNGVDSATFGLSELACQPTDSSRSD